MQQQTKNIILNLRNLRLNISYIWVLVSLCPFIGYLMLNHASYRTSPLLYICSIITIIYLIYYYIKDYTLPEITKLNFGIIAFSFLVLYLAFILSVYYTFELNAFDFSLFRSLIEYSLNGILGYSHEAGIYHFGIHTNWILILVSFIYYYIPSPITLLVIGNLALWLPGIFIFYYCQKHLHLSSFIALLASIVYWNNNFTMMILKAYFYPEFFYILAFLFFLLARKQRSLTILILATFFFASIKEDFIFYLAPWCLYNIFILKDKRFYYVLVISLGIFLINNLYIQPYFLSKSNLPFPWYYHFWNIWGTTPKEIIVNILTHPGKAFIHILGSSGWKRLYGALLFIPWLSLDMLSFSIIPVILYSLAAHNSGLSNFQNYYSYAIWPAALIGYMQFISKIHNSSQNNIIKYKKLINTLLLIVLIISCLWSNNGLPVYQFNKKDYSQFLAFKSQIDRNTTYCVKENIYPYFSDWKYKQFYPLTNIKEHPNCYILINANGNNYPYKNLAAINTIKILKNSSKCVLKDFNPFYVIDNSSVCHQLILNNLQH